MRALPVSLPLAAAGVSSFFLGESAGNVLQDRLWPRLSHEPDEPVGPRDLAGRSAGLATIALGGSIGLPLIAPKLPTGVRARPPSGEHGRGCGRRGRRCRAPARPIVTVTGSRSRDTHERSRLTGEVPGRAAPCRYGRAGFTVAA